MFGHDHEIQYDTIINHDTYTFFRISLEVPRGQDTEALVFLNGKEIGKVQVFRDGKKTLGYSGFRKYNHEYIPARENNMFKQMGKAIASIISDFVI